MSKLTHIDHTGRAVMVDVSHKSDTSRVAIARGEIHMTKATLDLIRAGQIKKGDVLTVAQIAGISASKRTSDLIRNQRLKTDLRPDSVMSSFAALEGGYRPRTG